MGKRRWLLTAALTVMSASAAYAAGLKLEQEAQITGNTAIGALGSVRRLPNGVANKAVTWCRVDGGVSSIDHSIPFPAIVTCHAEDPNLGSLPLECNTDSPSAVQAVAAINGDSYVSFEVIPSGPFAGKCLWVSVENSSAWPPKLL